MKSIRSPDCDWCTASFYGLINLFPLMNDAEANTTLIKAIGVSPTVYILISISFSCFSNRTLPWTKIYTPENYT